MCISLIAGGHGHAAERNANIRRICKRTRRFEKVRMLEVVASVSGERASGVPRQSRVVVLDIRYLTEP